MQKKKLISFILPVYNEHAGLKIIFDELTHYAQKLTPHYDYEIIFVNDGSSDASWRLIKDLAQHYPCVKGISFIHNFGYQYALTAGYDYAQGDALITMDSDMQHPPYLIEKMIEQWEQGYKIVYAKRTNRDDTFLKKITATIYYKILQTIGTISIPRNVSDFRLIDKNVAHELRKIREKARYMRGLVAWLGFNHSFVDYKQPARIIGTTKYTWAKLFKIAFDGIISFSRPFSSFMYISSILLFVSVPFIGYMIIKSLLYSEEPFITISVSLLFFMSICQIFFITLLGKHVEKIYEHSQQRPPYCIADKINC